MNNGNTESKLQEAEARNSELSRQVADLKKELEDMTYAVSHDLRAPLRAVHGFADALQEDYGSSLDGEAQRYLKIIGTSTRQMTRMIDGILTLSRLGRQPLQPSVVPMGDIVQSIVEDLKLKFPERQINFVINNIPAAQGDSTLLRQVWTHLLYNAVKFTAGKDPATITVDAAETPDETIYSVQDNGIGFDMKYEPKLFGLFQRFHTEAQFEGTGVGLAVVRRLVTRHGGRTWAKSETDAGSTFSFSLPKSASTPSSGL